MRGAGGGGGEGIGRRTGLDGEDLLGEAGVCERDDAAPGDEELERAQDAGRGLLDEALDDAGVDRGDLCGGMRERVRGGAERRAEGASERGEARTGVRSTRLSFGRSMLSFMSR